MNTKFLQFMIFIFSFDAVMASDVNITSTTNQAESLSEYDLRCLIEDNWLECPSVSFKYTQVLAEQYGNSDAKLSLALMYKNGNGVEKDNKQALKWYKEYIGVNDKYDEIYQWFANQSNRNTDDNKQNINIENIIRLVSFMFDNEDEDKDVCSSFFSGIVNHIIENKKYELLSETFYGCLVNVSIIDINTAMLYVEKLYSLDEITKNPSVLEEFYGALIDIKKHIDEKMQKVNTTLQKDRLNEIIKYVKKSLDAAGKASKEAEKAEEKARKEAGKAKKSVLFNIFSKD